VLEHFPHPNPAVERLFGLLSPNGIIYIKVLFQFYVMERVKFLLAESAPAFSVSSIHHASFFKPSTVTSLFVRTGMQPRLLRIFDKTRYPAETFRQRGKRRVWQALSWFGEGLFIEATFGREPNLGAWCHRVANKSAS
jgi:2-polyprenyl-3-methyl-5-hydroxy-6-metoxy-1,4-benzoquinol methylase